MKLIDIDDGGDNWTRTFTVEHDDGKTYKIEEWATSSGCGVEVYDEEGNALYGDDDPFSDEFMEEHIRPLEVAYQTRFDAEVQPIIDKIKAEVFGG